jgi:S1-C subfamily serine protease
MEETSSKIQKTWWKSAGDFFSNLIKKEKGELPQGTTKAADLTDSEKKPVRFQVGKFFGLIILVVVVSSIFGFVAGIIGADFFSPQIKDYLANLNNTTPSQGGSSANQPSYAPQTSQEEATVKVVNEVSKSVVSIIVTKDLPVIEQYYVNPFPDSPFNFQIPQYRQKGTEKQEVGGGTGFVVSEDGLILTNNHVVADTQADYTVLTNDGKKYSAQVLARDAIRDLAVIKVKDATSNFPTLKLGDSDNLQIGQTIIAIGNALGEFRNTVSVGVISGLGRTVTASGGGAVETQEDVIQTDAAINPGNSGGPLLNLKGEVIGVNFAMAQSAENIGFAIPINKAKKDIRQVMTIGKISYPFLGVRYVALNDSLQQENKLPVNYGAWVQKGTEGEPAITPGSAAEKAGLKEGDIILEVNNEKVTTDNSLSEILTKFNAGDKITLKIMRSSKEMTLDVTLTEMAQ